LNEIENLIQQKSFMILLWKHLTFGTQWNRTKICETLFVTFNTK